MNALMDLWIEEWMDGCRKLDEWCCGWNGRIGECTEVWIDGWCLRDEWMDECIG
jgi:hypothetical protein